MFHFHCTIADSGHSDDGVIISKQFEIAIQRLSKVIKTKIDTSMHYQNRMFVFGAHLNRMRTQCVTLLSPHQIHLNRLKREMLTYANKRCVKIESHQTVKRTRLFYTPFYC